MMNPRLDPLISISGQKISTVHDWETYRREEILVLLSNFVYGVRPMERPDDLHFAVTGVTEHYLGFPLVKKDVKVSFLGFSFPFSLFLPEDRYGREPVPAFLFLLNEARVLSSDPIHHPDCDFLPITQIASRGYGCAVLSTLDISPDWNHHPRFKKGVFAAVDPNAAHRDDRSWGNISGWAYGASRVMDYLETDSDVEHTKIAVCGHSRAGKTALWTGATDPRFALVISNASGCTGAAYTRGKQGEHVKDINISDWFCGNYHKYNDNEELLPCDQHLLLAAIAPRPLYVKSCAEDLWADPEAELCSCRMASPVYELYGKPGLIAPETIEPDTPYHEGTIAYHRAAGDHNLTAKDWQLYMDFADRYLK